MGPSARTAGEKWMWADLKQSMLFYQDLKGREKGVISLANARLTVIKTKVGRLWRPQNYIRVVNPDRALLGEYRECVLFFRNGKEMEEWYLALKVATTLNFAKSLAAQTQQRNHYSALFRAIGFDWQASSIPSMPRPSSVSPMPGEPHHPVPQHSSHAGPHPILSSDDDLKVRGTGSPTPNAHGNVDAKWVNMLTHRIWNFLHNDPGFVGLVKKQIHKKLAKLKKPKMLKSLALKGINFGNKLPIASNISVRSADPDGNLRLDADIAYHGEATVELDLVIEVEILGKKIATLPVSIKAVIKSIIGRIQLAFSAPPSDSMWMGFYTEPHIDLDIDSFFGDKHRLVNIPQLASIIVTKLRQEIVEMMLLPDMDDWPLPHLKVPRGESREKLVTWEYAAGYVPPPKIRTAYDSSSDEDDIEAQELYKYQEARNFASNASGPSSSSSSSRPLSSTFASSTEVPLVGIKKTGASPTPAAPTQAGSTPSSRSSSQTTFSSSSFSQKPLPSVPAGPPKLPPKPDVSPTFPARRPANNANNGNNETTEGKPLLPDRFTPAQVSRPYAGSFPSASFTSLDEKKKVGEQIPQSALPPNVVSHSAAASSSLHADPLADQVQKSAAEVAEDGHLSPPPGLDAESSPHASHPIFGPEPGTKTPVQPSGPITKYETLTYASEDARKAAGASPDALLIKGTQLDVNHSLHIPVGTADARPTLFSVPDQDKRDELPTSSSPVPVGSAVHEKTEVKEGDSIGSPNEDSTLNKSAAGVLKDATFDPLLHPSDPFSDSPPPIALQSHASISTASRDSSASDLSAASPKNDSKSDSSSPKVESIRGTLITDIIDVPTSLEPEVEDWTSTLPGGSPILKSNSNSSVSSAPGVGGFAQDSHSPEAGFVFPEDQSTTPPPVSGETGSGKLKLSAVPHSDLDAKPSKPALPPRSLGSSAADPFDDIFAGAQDQTIGFHAALQPPPQLPPRGKKTPTTAASPPDSTSFPSGIYSKGSSYEEKPKSTNSSSSSPSSSKPSSAKDKRSSVKESLLSFIDSIKEKMDD